MTTKAELEREIGDLKDRLDDVRDSLSVAEQDLADADDRAWELERRIILVKAYYKGALTDAVVIPPTGLIATPVSIDLIDPENYVELWTEVLR